MEKVSYVWSEDLIRCTNAVPAVLNRASKIHSLISAYELFKHLIVVTPTPASIHDLREFHSEPYINHLKQFQCEVQHKDHDENYEYEVTSKDEEYGIAYDCAPVSNLYEVVTQIAGSSIVAARTLTLGLADVAINWCGGWHHAKRSKAEGFCYVNDIVIAIEKLRKKFKKILYVDLDVHHGDGVEEAFKSQTDVFTLSFHKYEPGFYPGSGGIYDIGDSEAKGYSANFPLKAAYSDQTIEYIFEKCFQAVCCAFNPQAVVVQCGADALSRDPHGGGNLTASSYIQCVQDVLKIKKPTLLLGGGGYNFVNAARLWTAITASVLNVTLDPEIPDHEYWLDYAPDYSIHIQPARISDQNTILYLDDCINKINDHLIQYVMKRDNQKSVERQNKIFKSKYCIPVKQSCATPKDEKSVYDFE